MMSLSLLQPSLLFFLVVFFALDPCQGYIVPRMSSSQTNTASATSKSKRLYPFKEARRIARGHGFDSKEEFIEYDCAGAYQLPKNADEVWASDWTSWHDFLGIPLDFEEARKVAKTLGLEREEEYLTFMKEKKMDDDDLSSRLPYRPDLKFKKEWKGWNDFLGLLEEK